MHFNAIKPLKNLFLSGFQTLCHPEFRHCLKSGCAINQTQTSCPKSGLVWISDTHCNIKHISKSDCYQHIPVDPLRNSFSGEVISNTAPTFAAVKCVEVSKGIANLSKTSLLVYKSPQSPVKCVERRGGPPDR